MLDELIRAPGPSAQQTDRMLAAVHTGIDEMARTQAWTRRFLVAVSVTAVMGVCAQVFMKPPNAFASWTATPQALPLAHGGGEFSRCLSEAPPLPPGVLSAANSKPVLAERRGSFTAALLVDSSTVTICIHDDRTRAAGRVPRVATPAGASIVLEANGGSQDEGEVRYVFGTVADHVGEVVVHLANGDDVKASVEGGQFLAWWPSGRTPASIEARRGNAILQQLSVQG